MHAPEGLEGFDPLDTRDGIPHEALARLRAEAPVYRTPGGVFYLALQEDVLAGAKAVDIFRANFREPGVVVPPEEMLVSEIPEPRHGQIRKVVNSAVAAHRLGRIEPVLRELTSELIDRALAAGGGELVAELITPIPTSIIAHLLGAPPEDWALWARWSDEVVGGDYPTQNRTERGEGLAGGHPEFAAYIDAMIDERRASNDPPPDFVTRLLQTRVEGVELSDVELRTLVAFLLISGNETTRHLLGNLVLTLAQRPDLFAALRAEPERIANFVEESLRIDAPVAVLMREAMQDTEVRGIAIPRGSQVAFGIASANRDERVYDDPHSFRLDRRQPKGHVGFGGGPHVCPGAALARMEGRVLVELLVARVESLSLPESYQREKVDVFWANGPRSLPAQLSA
ncbi:MAG: cytochrome P450 [Myxococcota bacterium]